MDAPIRCDCGKLQGSLTDIAPGKVNRLVCYCDDCQAFAHFLGKADAVLDAAGGTDIAQMAPAHVTFTAGHENLACMRLSENGVHRWYASCCNSPVGNTGGYGMPFLGLIHACVDTSATDGSDGLFGPARGSVNTKYAHGEVATAGSTMGAILRFLRIMLGAKISGGQRRSPFFDAGTEKPVVVPKVLSEEERSALLARVPEPQSVDAR